jgi:hypothetical protein
VGCVRTGGRGALCEQGKRGRGKRWGRGVCVLSVKTNKINREFSN